MLRQEAYTQHNCHTICCMLPPAVQQVCNRPRILARANNSLYTGRKSIIITNIGPCGCGYAIVSMYLSIAQTHDYCAQWEHLATSLTFGGSPDLCSVVCNVQCTMYNSKESKTQLGMDQRKHSAAPVQKTRSSADNAKPVESTAASIS